jgi:hypothetical protein
VGHIHSAHFHCAQFNRVQLHRQHPFASAQNHAPTAASGYRAFGLTISSELRLPGLPFATVTDTAIQIRRAPVPALHGDDTISNERYRIRGQEWYVQFRALPFTSLISDGNLVRFESDPAQDDLARLHVLGSCAGALLFQRGSVPLHGNSIVTPQGAVMLTGKIGAGKSATTLSLLERGHGMLADDLSAVAFDGSQLRVTPGFPRLKLWRRTLEHFDYCCNAFLPLRPGGDKFYYPTDHCFRVEPQLLRAIYILRPCDNPGISVLTLSGIAKLRALRAHLYKIRFDDAIRNWPALMGKMCRLADEVRVSIVERPREGSTIEAVTDAIEADLLNAGHV